MYGPMLPPNDRAYFEANRIAITTLASIPHADVGRHRTGPRNVTAPLQGEAGDLSSSRRESFHALSGR